LETAAQIAASLGVPQSDLMLLDPSDGEGSPTRPIIVLTAAVRTRTVINVLRESASSNLDYLVEADGGPITDAIFACVNAVEPHLPTLTPEPDFQGFPRHHWETLGIRERLALESQIASAISSLKSAGLALYVGRYTVRMKVPWYDLDEGHWYISARRQPEDVRVAVLRIDRSGQDRIVVDLPRWGEVARWMNT
jgi:hypothetical protein